MIIKHASRLYLLMCVVLFTHLFKDFSYGFGAKAAVAEEAGLFVVAAGVQRRGFEFTLPCGVGAFEFAVFEFFKCGLYGGCVEAFAGHVLPQAVYAEAVGFLVKKGFEGAFVAEEATGLQCVERGADFLLRTGCADLMVAFMADLVFCVLKAVVVKIAIVKTVVIKCAFLLWYRLAHMC